MHNDLELNIRSILDEYCAYLASEETYLVSNH